MQDRLLPLKQPFLHPFDPPTKLHVDGTGHWRRSDVTARMNACTELSVDRSVEHRRCQRRPARLPAFLGRRLILELQEQRQVVHTSSSQVYQQKHPDRRPRERSASSALWRRPGQGRTGISTAQPRCRSSCTRRAVDDVHNAERGSGGRHSARTPAVARDAGGGPRVGMRAPSSAGGTSAWLADDRNPASTWRTPKTSSVRIEDGRGQQS
jgi:hypothetical protein